MNRIEKYYTLRDLLSSITTNVYDVCVNGNTEFNKKLDEIFPIGRGSFGKVYLASLNNHTFVVKEATVPTEQSNKIKYNKIYNEILPSNSYVDEYKIMELLSEQVVKGGFPNFILSYKAAVCETCLESRKEICFMIFMEPAMCNFDEFIVNMASITMISNYRYRYSIIYQLLLGMCVFHLKYGIFHQDLHSQNIIVLKVKTGGYFRYIMNEKEYLVKNYGYLFCLHDFGSSMILNPNYSSGEFYGTRNVLVNQDGLLEPIYRDNSNVINWLDGRTGTDNKFTINSNPDKFIDLTDMKKFPPMEFFYDICEIMYQFDDLPKINLISDKLYKQFSYDEDSAMYLRADMMLDYLYEKPIGVTNDYIVETFHLT
jgi:hypothetical protein